METRSGGTETIADTETRRMPPHQPISLCMDLIVGGRLDQVGKRERERDEGKSENTLVARSTEQANGKRKEIGKREHPSGELLDQPQEKRCRIEASGNATVSKATAIPRKRIAEKDEQGIVQRNDKEEDAILLETTLNVTPQQLRDLLGKTEKYKKEPGVGEIEGAALEKKKQQEVAPPKGKMVGNDPKVSEEEQKKKENPQKEECPTEPKAVAEKDKK